MSTPTIFPTRLAAAEEAPTAARSRSRAFAATVRPELVALLVLAAVLNLWGLGLNGYANDYYAAGVRSMTESWHAFLFGSFDAAGIMTVDKPPLSSWIQALSARAFGFSSWSLLVPQALMGVGSVALLWSLVARRFGQAAGFAAGLALAVTPITVAISRHNNPDALLVLCSVAALWALVRGLEDGRTRWLVWAGVFVGLGFEAKMAAALMVVPGIVAAWLYVAPRALARGDAAGDRLALRDRLDAAKQLLAGGAAMLVVGLAWPVLVWLTPADSRPWVSGTDDNSIWSLILGYNGLGRLFGQSGGPGGGAGAGGGPGGGGGGGGMGGVFGGDTGPLRLLNDALGGQAGWLLGFALLAGAALLVITRLRRTDARSGWLIAVGGAWLVTAVAFSKAQGIFHPYYVSLLAPFTAALVGAGVGVMVRSRVALAHDSADAVTAWAVRLLGPLAIAGGVVTTLVVLHDHPDSLPWLAPVLVAGAVLAAAALLVAGEKRLRAAVVAAVMGLMLLAPATWAVQTLGHATSSTFPAGGPTSASAMGGPGGGGPGGGGRGGFGRGGMNGAPPQGFAPGGGRGGMFGGDSQSLATAVAYAKAHGGGTVAVSSQSGASRQLIDGDADVVAIGGFSGRESQVTLDWLADRVADGDLRWFVTDGAGGGMMRDSRVGASDVLTTVANVCTPASTTSSGASASDTTSAASLYDCAGKADALRAAG